LLFVDGIIGKNKIDVKGFLKKYENFFIFLFLSSFVSNFAILFG
jgi:hypothetical protein